MRKRLTAALSMLFLLHLSVVAGDLACASHHQAVRGAHAAQMAGHSHGQPPVPSRDSDDSRDCDTPLSSRCCTAAQSCSTAFAPTVVDGFDQPPANVAAVTARLGALVAYAAAPATPPPKA